MSGGGDDREALRKFEGDVFYEAWSRGINPDRAAECAYDCYRDGITPTECVDGTARMERRERESRQLARDEAAYLEEQERQRYEEQERERLDEGAAP